LGALRKGPGGEEETPSQKMGRNGKLLGVQRKNKEESFCAGKGKGKSRLPYADLGEGTVVAEDDHPGERGGTMSNRKKE